MLVISVEVAHTTGAKKAALSDKQYYAQANGRLQDNEPVKNKQKTLQKFYHKT